MLLLSLQVLKSKGLRMLSFFFNDLQVCASLNFVDDVINLSFDFHTVKIILTTPQLFSNSNPKWRVLKPSKALNPPPPPQFPSVFHCRLATSALMKLHSGSRSYIFRFFIAYRFLTLRKQILYENMHLCLNRYVNFHLKNKRAMPDDNVHLPFQQFLPITILIYTEAL